MHNLIMTVVTNIDKTVALVPEVVLMIYMIVRIEIINLPLVFARSKTTILMIKRVCNLALVLVPLVPQAALMIFMVTLMMGMQTMFIPKNMAKLNDLFHPKNNKNMINENILYPVQPG